MSATCVLFITILFILFFEPLLQMNDMFQSNQPVTYNMLYRVHVDIKYQYLIIF